MRGRKIYARRRMDSWSSIKIPIIGGEVPLSGDGVGSCGLILCYATLKAFKKDYPKETPLIYRIEAGK